MIYIWTGGNIYLTSGVISDAIMVRETDEFYFSRFLTTEILFDLHSSTWLGLDKSCLHVMFGLLSRNNDLISFWGRKWLPHYFLHR